MYDKNNPFLSKILSVEELNKPGSTKRVLHVSCEASSFPCPVGSSCGIYPFNSNEIVNRFLKIAKVSRSITVTHRKERMPIYKLLKEKLDLGRITPRLLKYLGNPNVENSISLIEKHWDRDLEKLLAIMPILLPRYYSIASSQLFRPNSVDFMVEHFYYKEHGIEKESRTASYLLSSDIAPLFLNKNDNFQIADDSKEMILIGLGTGLAPFRGFLQERLAKGIYNKSWLFMGDRQSKFDFYYEKELLNFKKQKISKLSPVFSRDPMSNGITKELNNERKEIHRWIKRGAFIYICGSKSLSREVMKSLDKIEDIETIKDRLFVDAY